MKEGGGEEKRAGNTSENGFIGCGLWSSRYLTCHVEDSPNHLMQTNFIKSTVFNLYRKSGEGRQKESWGLAACRP